MITTLIKHGDSYALVIDKPLLELLRISPDTPFEVVTDGQCRVLTPMRGEADEQKSRTRWSRSTSGSAGP